MDEGRGGPLGSFVDYLCLVYHEARNVRHLIRGGHVDATNFERLRSLQTNRDRAWEEMRTLREEARSVETAGAAAETFAHGFGHTLEDLVELFDNPNWENAGAKGGYPWTAITRRVIRLREALDGDDPTSSEALLQDILRMRHNTGDIATKLRSLEASTSR